MEEKDVFEINNDDDNGDEVYNQVCHVGNVVQTSTVMRSCALVFFLGLP